MFDGATVLEPDQGVEQMVGRQWVHPGLEGLAPGPELAAFLSVVDPSCLSGLDRVRVLRARQRLVSHFQALVYSDMAAIGDSYAALDDEDGDVGAAAEIRVALNLTRRAADIEYSFALELRDRLPLLFQMLLSGVLDQRRVKVIESATSHLDEDTARMVVDRISDQAPTLTTGQLAARIRKLCIEADPDDAKDRLEEAVQGRRMVVEPSVDGSANLMGLDLPPERASAASQRVNKLALQLKTSTEPLSMDQLRADVFLDLLLGTENKGESKSSGGVNITVDLQTLARLDEKPGELAGFGPVVADIARQTTAEQSDQPWKFTITDQGRPVHTGTTRRRPTADVQREVLARNETCVFPGCRMPAVDCDLDHTIEWAQDGPTTTDNLVPLCRHDHVIRHTNNWTYQQHTDGTTQWTSPLGHTTNNQPP